MVSRGSFRALGVSVAAFLFALIGTSVVSAAPSCTVSVSPKTGTAGTVFTFHGSGFKPTHLTLHKDDAAAGDHDLSPASDPWTVTVRSRPGDEGSWSAEFTAEKCSAVAAFTVTMLNTDVADARTAPAGSGPVPISLAALVLVTGAAGGIVLGRKVREIQGNP